MVIGLISDYTTLLKDFYDRKRIYRTCWSRFLAPLIATLLGIMFLLATFMPEKEREIPLAERVLDIIAEK